MKKEEFSVTVKNKLFIGLSEEILSILEDHDLSVQDILKEAGIEVEVRRDALPSENPDERTLDLVPAIEASGFIISQAVTVISAALNKLTGRAFEETYYENETVRDNNGNPILNKNGTAKTFRKISMKKSEKPFETETTTSFTVIWGEKKLEFKRKTSEKN